MSITVKRQDSIPQAFLRELEDIEKEVHQIEFAEIPFADGAVVPLDIQNKPGKRTTTYRQSTASGRFKLMRGYSTAIPTIQTLFKEFTQRIHKFAGQYIISDDDIEAAKEGDFPLEQADVASVREAAMQEMNRLIAFGDPSIEMPGLLNSPDVLRSFVPTPWNASSTSAQILASMHDGVTSMVDITKQVEQPNIMYVPPVQYNYIATNYANPAAAIDKILRDFTGSNPYVKEVRPLLECKGAGPNGEDVALIMKRDPRKLKAMIYQPFTFLEMVRAGLGYQRPAVFRYGGLRLYRPWSVHLLIGI